MAIFVNKDTFNGLGNYSKEEHNLGSYVCGAWLSALGLLELPEYRTLVALNNKPHYLERLRGDRYGQQIATWNTLPKSVPRFTQRKNAHLGEVSGEPVPH